MKEFKKIGNPSELRAQVVGLEELAKLNVIPVSQVLGLEGNILRLVYVENDTGQFSNPEFWKTFGSLMAKLHKSGTSSFYGFSEDNFIGPSKQKNTPTVAWHGQPGVWADFFWHYRILPQLELAKTSFPTAASMTNKLAKAIQEILGPVVEAPCLLHGDFWNGNFLAPSATKPVLIDPAVYYGHRETDLAMAKLFGGFEDLFFKTYHKHFPLKRGFERREAVYRLYPLLNHLNLFGKEYERQVEECVTDVLENPAMT